MECFDVSGLAKGTAHVRPKVIIGVNEAWNLLNFRAGLIRALVATGYEVVAVAPPDKSVPRLADIGCRFVPLPMVNQGTNPVWDALLLCRFLRLMHKEKPNAYLSFTIKPNIYGSLAAHAFQIPVVNNITGLGAVFMRENWLTSLARSLYRLALSRSGKVFFQNDDDRALFLAHRLVREAIADRLPGSGINLNDYQPVPLPDTKPVKFLLVARMLWDKGVGEFVEAARLLKKQGVQAEFCLLGPVDVQNPSAISRDQMNKWLREGVVRYLGVSDDIRGEMSQAHCVVLPSYREGTPRSLMEAAAMARPIVTTDVPGCRDVVEDVVNGFLCRPQDAVDLACKMKKIVQMSSTERATMGNKGRYKMEREFDEQIVVEKYMQALNSIHLGKQD